jgi:hypothetical protein
MSGLGRVELVQLDRLVILPGEVEIERRDFGIVLEGGRFLVGLLGQRIGRILVTLQALQLRP